MVGQSLVEIGQVILEKIFKIFVNVLLLFPFYLHSVKSIILYLNKPKFPLPKDSLWQVWVKLAPWFWRRFLYFVNVFFAILYRILGNIRRYFFSPAHGYRLILLIRLILFFFLKKNWEKNHIFKQNYEKNLKYFSNHAKHNRKRKNNL